MISDVLSEASGRLRRYLREMPDVYAGCEEPIRKIILVMDAARIALDTPPGPLDPEEKAVWLALANLDVDEITAALNALKGRAQVIRGRGDKP
jgi:hypothetical protein